MNPQLQRGLLLYQQARFELAEAELRQALATEPDDAYTHALLSLCLAQRQQFAEATNAANQAVHLGPDFAFAHYALASVLHDRHHLKEALAAVCEAIRLEPESPDSHALEAQVHLDQKQWREALAAAERGLQLDSEHVGCVNLRAIALVKLGRKAEAGATIEAALARHPDNAVTHANQGWTLLEKGEPARALEHFKEALRLDPNNEWARAGIVEALKARHFLYSLMLRYFLWMAKLSPQVQWGIVLGGYFGNRLLGAVAKNNAELAPWIWPVRIVYLVFVLLTWTADPLFNLLLRLNRFGRLALTEEQTRASNWVGACLLLALGSAGLCALSGFTGPLILAPIVFAFLVIPVAGTFNCQAGWPRRIMAIYSAVMAVAGVTGLALALLTRDDETESAKALRGVMAVLLGAFFLGALGAGWVANWLMMQRPKR